MNEPQQLPIRVNDTHYALSKTWKGFKDFEEYPPFIQQYCHACAKTSNCKVYDALKYNIENRGNTDSAVESPMLVRLNKQKGPKTLPEEIVSCKEFMRAAR